MTKEEPKSVDGGDQTQSLLVVFATLGSTTWRMFVPVIIGAVGGMWYDAQFGQKYAAITGALVGLAVAGLLVYRQYRGVTK